MDEQKVSRRRLLAAAVAGSIAPLGACNRDTVGAVPRNPLLWAVAWKQTAAEYRALCYQAFNLARMRIDQALQSTRSMPLAVVTDVDDTVLHAGSYWAYLVAQDLDFFDDSIWDAWIPQYLATAVPGSLEFFHYCESHGIEVFYVTSRDQGEQTFEFALQQLQRLEFPFADEEHLTVLRDTSDKSAARDRIGASHEVVVFIGDNLNDFKRDYYVKDIDERLALTDRDRETYGRQFIVLPNPTDGHWVRAIFGESEPAPTEGNHQVLAAAAMRGAWDGRQR